MAKNATTATLDTRRIGPGDDWRMIASLVGMLAYLTRVWRCR
jgi:hypothetical protein